MPCLPGFTPVMKLCQATGDSDGCVVSSLAKVPESASRFRFGSLPSSMSRRARVGSMPSKPITTTFCLGWRTGELGDEPPQAAAARAAAAQAAAGRRTPDRIIGTSFWFARTDRASLAAGILPAAPAQPVRLPRGIEHRGTQRSLVVHPLCVLCALCVSVVSFAARVPLGLNRSGPGLVAALGVGA